MRILLTVLFLGGGLAAYAQDKLDNLEGNRLLDDGTQVKLKEDSLHHPERARLHGSFSATGVISNANGIKSYTFNNAFKGSIVTKEVTLNLTGSWIYGEAAGILTNNDFNTSLDAEYYQSPSHFFYWGLADYTSSYSLGLIDQEQVGLGAGYNFLDKKKATLNISDGLIYESGDLYDSLAEGTVTDSTGPRIYDTFRNSLRLLGHWVVRDKVTLDGTIYYQNALASSTDYVIKLNASADFKLKKWLDFTASFVYNKFTRTGTETSLFTFGLTVGK